jgi:DNA-binding transcriptional ArsR family regulator
VKVQNKDAQRLLSLIWRGQGAPLYMLRNISGKGGAAESSSSFGALEEIVARACGHTFFGLLGRSSRSFSGDYVVRKSNVVWVDIDRLEGYHGSSQLESVERRLELLRIRPTATLSSGRGYWCFWKLTALIDVLEIERLNRALAWLLRSEGADRTCWDAARICRIPGSFNEKTAGGRVELVSITEGHAYSPPSLQDVLAREGALGAPNLQYRNSTTSFSPDDRWTAAAAQSRWRGKEMHLKYLTGEHVDDRSSVEHSIVCSLVWHGYSRSEIHDFFEDRMPSRYQEEVKRGRGREYLDRSVSKALKAAENWAPPRTPSCVSRDCSELPSLGQPRPYNQVSRVAVLQLIKGQGERELVADVCARTGCTERAVRHILKDLEGRGVVTKRKDQNDGRRVYYDLDDDWARELASLRWVTWGFLRRVGDPVVHRRGFPWKWV